MKYGDEIEVYRKVAAPDNAHLNKQEATMKKVLIAGATGYLGRYIIKEAKKQGYWVSALARKANKLDDLKDVIDEFCEAEITKQHTLNGICNGIETVI